MQFALLAVDGTKLKPNASRHKATSCGCMKAAEQALAAEVDARLTQAQQADAAEDQEHGCDPRGDEMPAWMADKQRRRKAIWAAERLSRNVRSIMLAPHR